MGFDHGTITFRVCSLPDELPNDALERFEADKAVPLERVGDEPSWGWVSGRFLLENEINAETAKCGAFYHVCLRQAERKIPAALLNAECRLTELARMRADKVDHLNRKIRKEIKEEVKKRLGPQMPPSFTGTYCAIDLVTKLLYVTATSDRQFDLFSSFFGKAMGFNPVPLSPDNLAVAQYGIEPTDIPAINISPELSDGSATGLLGENFLTWLWQFEEERQGLLPATKLGDFSLMIDGPLTFVAEGSGAFESSLRKGTPTISAEARSAMLVGKKLRSAKLVLARGKGEEWSCTMDASQFVFRGLKLPEGEAIDPVEVFEERMANLDIFRQVIFELFHLFLVNMSDPDKRAEYQKKAKKWVQNHEQN